MKVRKAVIPAAGLGTRFLPATKAMPKEMLPVIDKPAIQYVVEEVAAAGIRDVLIITGRGKRAIEDHFDRAVELEAALEKKGDRKTAQTLKELENIANIMYVRQHEPLGLGHAILCAEKFCSGEPFAVLLGDDIVVESQVPCIKQLMQEYERLGKPVIAVNRVEGRDVSKYGIVSVEEGVGKAKRILGLVEKPAPEKAPSNMAVIGRYVFTSEIFDYLRRTKPGLNGEIQLADALCAMLEEKNEVYAYEFSGKRYDLGDKADYVIATIMLALKREEIADKVAEALKELSGRN
jgi:UTP--glucose-1-phosphate uridylyltransferase